MPYQLNDIDIIIIKYLLEDDENLPAVIRGTRTSIPTVKEKLIVIVRKKENDTSQL